MLIQKAPETYYPEVKFQTTLRDLRLAHPDKPSVADCAHTLGVTQTTWLRYERGVEVKLSHAFLICRMFNVKIEDVWKPKT